MQMILFVYMLTISIITFITYGIDKWKAVHNRFRIRESVLLGLAAAGGAVGALAGMYAFHHKTRKRKFNAGVPLLAVLWNVILLMA